MYRTIWIQWENDIQRDNELNKLLENGWQYVSTVKLVEKLSLFHEDKNKELITLKR